ncbi:MAG: hypothetical protein U0359_20055 [Byssovorax sp.]
MRSLGIGFFFAAALLPLLARAEPETPPAPATLPASTAPRPVSAEVRIAAVNLLFDVRKIVEVQQSSGWKIDRYELEKMMPDALLSVCRTTDETRMVALTEASAEVARLGGPLLDALRKNGNKIDELKPLLFATRVENTLTEALRRAPSECPVWIAPRPDFRSIQIGVDRFTLTLEGGGAALLQIGGTNGGLTFGGGGGGRVLLGRGFNHTWSLRMGPELSIIALVQREQGTTALPLHFLGALPVVVRYTDISWHYNFEVAPLGLVIEHDPGVHYGVRLGAMVGISTLQVRSFIPWAGVGAAVEVFPTREGHPLFVNLRGGVRAGLDWDF